MSFRVRTRRGRSTRGPTVADFGPARSYVPGSAILACRGGTRPDAQNVEEG